MKFFFRSKEPSDPVIVVNSCLKFLLNRITDDLDSKEYCWNRPWGIKRFESMILAKSVLDYSFEKIVKDELSEDEKQGYYDLSNSSFARVFNAEFSELGIHFEEMREEIEKKIEDYSSALWDKRKPPEAYYQIFILITGSQTRTELEEEERKNTAGLKLMRTNEYFSKMVPLYEEEIKLLQEKIAAFDRVEIMLPHILRSARSKLKNIKIKKIKSLSKKLAKKVKKK